MRVGAIDRGFLHQRILVTVTEQNTYYVLDYRGLMGYGLLKNGKEYA